MVCINVYCGCFKLSLGANFYIEVFSVRYQLGMKNLEKQWQNFEKVVSENTPDEKED